MAKLVHPSEALDHPARRLAATKVVFRRDEGDAESANFHLCCLCASARDILFWNRQSRCTRIFQEEFSHEAKILNVSSTETVQFRQALTRLLVP